MNFIVVTSTPHYFYKNEYYAYGPYVREMNIWLKNNKNVFILAPLQNRTPSNINLKYDSNKIKIVKVPSFNLLGLINIMLTFAILPQIITKMIYYFCIADHIHLRTPCNMGVLGVLLQIFFPFKIKTAKYAGNWENISDQPLSYKFQKYILKNTFLSRNIKVLVYGEWEDNTKNIIPFFTASYKIRDKIKILPRKYNKNIKLLFVGSLSIGKNPILVLKTLKNLISKNKWNFSLKICGEGNQKNILEEYIEKNNLTKYVDIMGSIKAEDLKSIYMESHFLILPSKSEGWPKVVAEAMWWGCIPLATTVSCLPKMLGNGERGCLIKPKSKDISKKIISLIASENQCKRLSQKGIDWSRNFTLEKFEKDIQKLL